MYVRYFVPNYCFLGLLFRTVCVCLLAHLSDLGCFCFLFFLCVCVVFLISLAEDLSFNAIFL